MKKTIFKKTFRGHMALAALILTVFGFFTYHAITRWYNKHLSEELLNISESIKSETLDKIRKNKERELNKYLSELGRKIKTRITVIKSDGEVIADSEVRDILSMENHKGRPEIKGALQGKPSSRFRFSDTLDSHMLYLAVPLKDEETIIGAIRVSRHNSEISKLLNSLRDDTLKLILLTLIVSVIITFFLSRKISIPIQKLAAVSRKVASGDYSERVNISDKGEIGELSESFNHMVTKQQHLISEFKSKKEELDTIISSLTESLMVTDENDSIIITNRSFNNVFDYNPKDHKKYYEAIRSNLFYDLCSATKKTMKTEVREITINNRIFLTSSTPITSTASFVTTFHDITELRKLDKVKKDLVSNVSHELKTPLTSIIGFTETMLEDSDDQQKHCLDIIMRNAQRMSDMVRDLLTLSEVEEISELTDPVTVDLPGLAGRIYKTMDEKFKNKDIDFNLQSSDSEFKIEGDRIKLETLFTNLIENAFKYTDKGSVSVEFLKENKTHIRCIIKDTGIGIPPKHIDRIFERFYVVDQSRSREKGGTGLGLSIVKHITLLHNGTISVKNREKAGTEFTIILPVRHRNDHN